MGNIINDLFRSFFWFLGQFTLMLMDQLHNLVKTLTGFSVFSFDFFWQWWTLLCMFLALFILLRVAAMTFKSLTDEDYLEKAKPLNTIIKIGVISFVIGLAPIALVTFNEFAIEAVDNISLFVGGTAGEEVKPSNIIFSAGLDKEVDYLDVNINEKVSGEYKYLPTAWDLLLCVGSALITSFFYVLLAIQIAKRAFDIAFKVLISPIPISGIVNPNDQSFGTWIKLIVSDLTANFIQMLVLYLVLKVCSVPAVTSLGILTRIIILIGGLLCIVSAPSGVAQLLGNDIGVGSMLQQIASLKYATAGMGAAGAALKGTALTAGAAAVYGGGRMIGAEGILHGMGGGGARSSGGSGSGGSLASSLGGMNGYFQGSSFKPGSSDTGNTSERGSTGSSTPSFSTDGGNPTSPQAENYPSSSSQSEGNISSSQGQERNTSGPAGESFSEGRSASPSETVNQSSNQRASSNANSGSSQPKGSGSKFIAKKVSDYGRNSVGVKAAAARIASSGGSHLYQSSARRLSTQKRNVRTGETNESKFVQSSRVVHAVHNAVVNKHPDLSGDALRNKGSEPRL